jgi:hypothetical protein
MEKKQIFMVIFIGILFTIASAFNIVGLGLIGSSLLILWIFLLLIDLLKEDVKYIKRLEKRIKKLEKNNG